MKARGHQEFGARQEMRLERMAARLDLTGDQRVKIEALHEQAREEGLALRKKMMRLRHELEGELLQDAPSEKTVLSLNAKIGDLQTALKANRLRTRLAVREELTPEQRDKMLVMGQHRKHGRHGRSGAGPHGQQGSPLDDE